MKRKNVQNVQMKVVACRWKKRRKDSNQSDEVFEAYARKTLMYYGWNEDEITIMMKTIMEE